MIRMNFMAQIYNRLLRDEKSAQLAYDNKQTTTPPVKPAITRASLAKGVARILKQAQREARTLEGRHIALCGEVRRGLKAAGVTDPLEIQAKMIEAGLIPDVRCAQRGGK
jgi:hypothetical protein